MEKIVLKTVGGAPVAPYSMAIRKGNMVFISGQIATKGDDVIHGSAAEQTELAMENIKSILELNGYSMEDIVKCGLYFINKEDFPEINTIYAKYFQVPPARIATQVSRLYDDVLVEIDAIAIVE